MKLQIVALLAAVSLLLGGCSWLDGSYVSVTPHQEQNATVRNDNLTAGTYEELLSVMESIVSKGTESCVINLVNFEQENVEQSMANAAQRIKKAYPIGAYAVEKVSYEIGSNMGRAAIAVEITYRHSRTELHQIQRVIDIERAQNVIRQALENYDTKLVMLVDSYSEADFSQLVQDYALENPQTIMETPSVAWEAYGIGTSRVVELIFAYQTSRDALRTMQAQVQPVFDSAVLYVSGEGAEQQKFSQLHAFLMERFDYTQETSITPAYSLLRHGVGDSRAFATVYGAMCRAAGLDCTVVTGTRNGAPWAWNIVQMDGDYYHVDLLRSNEQDGFRGLPDSEMVGYVWDYSAYPACTGVDEISGEELQEEIISAETGNDA